MRTIFVGDRPSSLNTDPGVPFVGTPSFMNLLKWVNFINRSDRIVNIFNMMNSFTHDDLVGLARIYNTSRNNVKFVALGNNASKALKKLGIEHFKLPHPSPRNRQLNDDNFIASQLKKCEDYLRGKDETGN